MGLRFHRVFSILPGLRINLSKSGVSTSVGPRGADVNIGRHGVTTNAGIPGTGISYRSKVGSRGSKLGIGLVIAGLAFAAFKNFNHWSAWFHPAATNSSASVVSAAAPASGVLYVHRGGSVIRALPKASAHVLKKETKGQQVQLVSRSGDWVQVRDGGTEGWMRASVVGESAPH
jgi:hypothetical protein